MTLQCLPHLGGFPSLPFSEQALVSQTFDRASNNIQAQQYFRASFLGQHSLIGGFDYLTGPGVSQRKNQTIIDTIDGTGAVNFGANCNRISGRRSGTIASISWITGVRIRAWY